MRTNSKLCMSMNMLVQRRHCSLRLISEGEKSRGIKLWPLQVVKVIGDSIGSFIEMDDRFKRNPSKAVAHILVDLDPKGGA
jgi:hypothetical protein